VITRIIPINQLTAFLKSLVEDDEDLQDLWVDGEISNLTIARSGHAYFTLKDEVSQLPAVMWRHALARQRTVPREGDRVIVHGNVTLYQPRGSLQLQVDLIQPQGTGLLQLRLEQLRQQLEAEGLFDETRKRPLPAFPRRIGVVTSATGAVWHDIQHVIARRYPLAELVLAPASVQGEEAPASIVAALSFLQEVAAPDVIIVGRGGGSLEDLWAFNDERVVRAIFAARVPVISAVGHETDVTLADFVADMRAPTPSAAAELVVPDLETIAAWLTESGLRLGAAMDQRLAIALQVVDDMQQRIGRSSPAAQLEALRRELEPLAGRMRGAADHRLALARHDVDAFDQLFEALNPKALMCRGFSFVCDPVTGAPIRLIDDQLAVGDRIRAMLADGSILADVAQIDRVPQESGA
jgi:exodeoxyribonuclease VII large subunit